MAFTAGFNQSVTFTLDGQGQARTLKVRSHSWEEQVARLVTTHSESGGTASAVAGVLDGRGNVTAFVDSADLPQAGVNAVTAGAKGTITFEFATANALSAHVMIEKVNWTSEVEGLVAWNFDCSIDSTTGSYSRGS